MRQNIPVPVAVLAVAIVAVLAGLILWSHLSARPQAAPAEASSPNAQSAYQSHLSDGASSEGGGH